MPTAKELTKEQYQAYFRAAVSGDGTPEKVLTPQEKFTQQELMSRVAQAAEQLKSQFAVSRVILFGSVAHKGWFEDDSDVDIAVEGLKSVDFFRAWRVAEETIGDREVDIIELETAPLSLKRAIERYGVDL